jgi:uncharacterized glyoxalase superfamily protein PhnB
MSSPPPDGYPRVTPYLDYEDTGSMVEWLSRAFGLVERHHQAGPDGAVLHAEMELEDGLVMMGSPGGDLRNPKRLGQVTQSLYVYNDDVDAHCARAREAGAEIVDLSDPSSVFFGGGFELFVASAHTMATHGRVCATEDLDAWVEPRSEP